MPWEISGNSGTSAAQHFLGTTDAQAFSIRVNNKRALRIEAQAAPNLIGGHESNLVAPGVEGATIAGGGTDGSPNSVDANFGSIGGGRGNRARGEGATVAGGEENAAIGSFSFAAGRRAKANHAGTFVWADANDTDFISTAENQFLIQADGGVGIGTSQPAATLDIRGSRASLLRVGADNGVDEARLGLASDTMAGISFLSHDGLLSGSGAQAYVNALQFDRPKGLLALRTQNKNRILINQDGKIGISALHPTSGAKVSIVDEDYQLVLQNPGTNGGYWNIGHSNEDWFIPAGQLAFVPNAEPSREAVVRFTTTGDILHKGNLLQSSSRANKENIVELSRETAHEILAHLRPVEYNLKSESDHRVHLGFIAEEVPEVIAGPERETIIPNHIVAVLTLVVQEQFNTLVELREKISLVEERLHNSLSYGAWREGTLATGMAEEP